MPVRHQIGRLALFAAGLMLGTIIRGRALSPLSQPVHAQAAVVSPAANSDTVPADVAMLKDRITDQAHVMADVGYHASQLWFAGSGENWPLAQFYWNETRSHLRWAVRVIPVRKDNAGKEVNLRNILEAFENTPFKQLQDAITAQDRERFVKEYRFTLESCYACHKASDKPYLRTAVPEQPGDSIINFDPQATWPQ